MRNTPSLPQFNFFFWVLKSPNWWHEPVDLSLGLFAPSANGSLTRAGSQLHLVCFRLGLPRKLWCAAAQEEWHSLITRTGRTFGERLKHKAERGICRVKREKRLQKLPPNMCLCIASSNIWYGCSLLDINATWREGKSHITYYCHELLLHSMAITAVEVLKLQRDGVSRTPIEVRGISVWGTLDE